MLKNAHRLSTTSGAPFVTQSSSPFPKSCTVVIIFLSEENGISSILGIIASSLSLFSPISSAASTTATSVGSPVYFLSSLWQSVHKAARRSINFLSLSGVLSSSPLIFTAFILFFVSVPVLSVHMTCAEPSVSTAGSVLTMAFFRDMVCVPIARTMVTMAGSPSGMAATARLMDVINISNGSYRLSMPMANMTAQMPTAARPSILPVFSSLFCSGVSFFVPSSMRDAIFPTSVDAPVSVTIALPLPPVIYVDE